MPKNNEIMREIAEEYNDFLKNKDFMESISHGTPWTWTTAEVLKVRSTPLLPIYQANPYMSVREEAKRRKTSMRQICREKGLVYESLIF